MGDMAGQLAQHVQLLDLAQAVLRPFQFRGPFPDAAFELLVQRFERREQPPVFQRGGRGAGRSEEHTSELQSLMRISYAVFCLKKKKKKTRVSTSLLTVSRKTIKEYNN